MGSSRTSRPPRSGAFPCRHAAPLAPCCDVAVPHGGVDTCRRAGRRPPSPDRAVRRGAPRRDTRHIARHAPGVISATLLSDEDLVAAGDLLLLAATTARSAAHAPGPVGRTCAAITDGAAGRFCAALSRPAAIVPIRRRSRRSGCAVIHARAAHRRGERRRLRRIGSLHRHARPELPEVSRGGRLRGRDPSHRSQRSGARI